MKTPEGWGGISTGSKASYGQFEILENCYVSRDGEEIRSFPGFVCVVDPETNTRQYNHLTALGGAVQGYTGDHTDARRSVTAANTSGNAIQTSAAAATDVMKVWAIPQSIHFAEQVHGRWVLVGEVGHRLQPIYNTGRTSFVHVISHEDSPASPGLTRVTLSSAPDVTATLFNTIQVGRSVWLSGLSGAFAEATLNGRAFEVVNISGANLDLDVLSGGFAGVIADTGYISGFDLADAVSLGSWQTASPGSVLIDPLEKVYPAHVANRQRDFGDTSGIIIEGNSNTGLSRRQQKSLPYRLVPHIAGDRIVMAAPGYGCAFQIPLMLPMDFSESSAAAGVRWVSNDIYDKPRCSGVPKAQQWSPNANTQIVGNFGSVSVDEYCWGGSDAGAAGRRGTYKFKFAYKDEVTGEIGLCSEPVSATTGTTDPFESIQLLVRHPGYLMHESMALTINVYRTTKDGDTYYFDRTIKPETAIPGTSTTAADSVKYGLAPSTTANVENLFIRYKAIYVEDAVLVQQNGYVPEALEQMPMGCKASRTIRGWTFYGGSLGNAGPYKEMLSCTATMQYDRNSNSPNAHYPNWDRIVFRYTTFNNYTPTAGTMGPYGVETFDLCSVKWMPPAYSGQRLFSRTLFTYPRQAIRTNKLENAQGNNYSGGQILSDVRYSIIDSPIPPDSDEQSTTNRSAEAYLLLPQGAIQISEQDNPGVTPATNTTLISSELGEDIEGIGDAGGSAVVCSRSKTYLIGFSGTPVGVPSELATDRFGCIAPNSMVSFDGGCAWISDRGPVAMMGAQVSWIGAPLERWFSGATNRYLRDSDGMMRHSWACHDSERGLLYFGMFRDRMADQSTLRRQANYLGTNYTWSGAAIGADENKIKSRFPCDEVLVYNYTTSTWSVWQPPDCLGIMWMTTGVDSEGNNRVFFLGDDRRIYALDDSYGQFDRDGNYIAVAQSGSVSTITGLTTGIKMRTGMDVLFYSSSSTQAPQLLAIGTITSTTSTSITFSPAATLPAGGCKMVVGPRSMRIKTSSFNPKGQETMEVGKVGMRYSLSSFYTATGGDSGTAQPAFALAAVTTVVDRNQIKTLKTTSFTQSQFSSHSQIGEPIVGEPMFESGFALGRCSGQNHQIDLRVIGGCQVRISDLYAEVK